MGTLKYILYRVYLALISAFIILSLVFILIRLLPYERAVGTNDEQYDHYMSEVYNGYVVRLTEESDSHGMLLLKHTSAGTVYYFYEAPLLTQYVGFVRNIFRWEWGLSTKIKPGTSAITIITERLPVSMQINFIATCLSVPLGILLGVIAALKKNTKIDHLISTSVIIISSVPSFVFITVLLYLFAYNLDWIPSTWPGNNVPWTTKLSAYALPIFCLLPGPIAGFTRFVRGELTEVISSDYLLLARTKGLTENQAVVRHALKNAMVPVLPSVVASFIGIIGGSIILERLYGIPGIGRLFLDAFTSKDYNVLFFNMVIFTTFGLLVNILTDLSYGFLDPRVRMGGKK